MTPDKGLLGGNLPLLKHPMPKRRKLLVYAHICKLKASCLNSFNVDRVSFSTPEQPLCFSICKSSQCALLFQSCYYIQDATFFDMAVGLPELASRVADFFLFWAVFSKRTLLTKSVVWKGAQQTLSLTSAAAEGLQAHFNMGALTMPSRQPKSVREQASKSKPSQSKKNPVCTWRFDRRICW